MENINQESSDLIDKLGGTSKTAEIFGIKPPSVTAWRYGDGIPEPRLMYLRVVRPDLFEDRAH